MMMMMAIKMHFSWKFFLVDFYFMSMGIFNEIIKPYITLIHKRIVSIYRYIYTVTRTFSNLRALNDKNNYTRWQNKLLQSHKLFCSLSLYLCRN